MEYIWKITDHACRACLGRIVECIGDNGKHRVRCCECGLEVEGGPKALCACGQKDRSGRDAGLRCIRNAEQRPELPQEIVVVSVPPSQRRRERRAVDCATDGNPVLQEVVE